MRQEVKNLTAFARYFFDCGEHLCRKSWGSTGLLMIHRAIRTAASAIHYELLKQPAPAGISASALLKKLPLKLPAEFFDTVRNLEALESIIIIPEYISEDPYNLISPAMIESLVNSGTEVFEWLMTRLNS